MKSKIACFILFVVFVFGINAQSKSNVEQLNQSAFNKSVGNYSKSDRIDKINKIPVIIDFYATWCGPCKLVSPILDELSIEYAGKIQFYKVDIDENTELATKFKVQVVPTLAFIDSTGKITIITGAYPKEELVKTIDYVFFNK